MKNKKKILFFLIFLLCLIIYLAMVLRTQAGFAPVTQVKYYETGETVTCKEFSYHLLDFSEITLEELIERYGISSSDEQWVYLGSYRYCILTLEIENNSSDTAVCSLIDIELQSKYWYSQLMGNYVPLINGEGEGCYQSLKAGEKKTITYVYPISYEEEKEEMIYQDWYLAFKGDGTKHMLAVRE